MVYYTLMKDIKMERCVDNEKMLGVFLDTWIDLQAEIETR